MGKFCPKECAKDVLIEFNGPVEDFLPFNSAVAVNALHVHIEHIERNRVLYVVWINQHELVRQALLGSRAEAIEVGDCSNEVALAVDHDN